MDRRLATPLLSVITPTYNRASLLSSCVESVRLCGVPSYEHLIVDDGSTDATASFIPGLRPEVRYVRQSNAGPSAARNRGFSLSRAPYVAFLDSDDHWLPGVAGDLVDLLERHPKVDVVFTDARVGNEQEGFRSLIERRGASRLLGLPGTVVEDGMSVFKPAAFFRLLTEFNWIFFGAAIVRREAFDRCGGYDPALNQAEDWDVCLRMASRSTFAFWPQALAIYNTHPGERLSTNVERMTKGFVTALKNTRDRCPELAITERLVLKHRLRDQMFGYAYLAYHRGDWKEARSRFGWLLRECGPEAVALSYWFLCLVPTPMRDSLRRLKRLW